MRFQEHGTQGRTQRQGVDGGEADGDGHGKTKLLVECTCGTSHKAHRDEHGHHHQSDGYDGTTQLLHGIDTGHAGISIALVEFRMDALHNHNGIIDHNGNGEH